MLIIKISSLKAFEFTNTNYAWKFNFSNETLMVTKNVDLKITLNKLKNWGFFIQKIKPLK